MLSIIEIPASPLCKLDQTTGVNAGEFVVAEKLDGKKVMGKLDTWNMENAVLSVRVHGIAWPLTIGFGELKVLYLPRLHPCDRVDQRDTATLTQPFTIIFTNDAEYSGDTLGYKKCEQGLFLFPCETRNQYRFAFIPHGSIKSCELQEPAADLFPAESETPPKKEAKTETPAASPKKPVEKPAAKPKTAKNTPQTETEADQKKTEPVFELEMELAEISIDEPEEVSSAPQPVAKAAPTPPNPPVTKPKIKEKAPPKVAPQKTTQKSATAPKPAVTAKKSATGTPAKQPPAAPTPEPTATPPPNPVHQESKVSLITDAKSLEEALKQHHPIQNRRLGEVLKSARLIDDQQLNEALEAQRNSDEGLFLGQLLVKLGFVSQEQIQQSLAQKLGIPFVSIRKFEVTPDVIKLVPPDLVSKHQLVPLYIYNGKLIVAVEDPLRTEGLDSLRFHTNMYVEAVIATPEDIEWAIQFYYDDGGLQSTTLDDLNLIEFETLDGDSDELEMDDIEGELADNVVVKLINKVILDAYNQNVSDIHIEPYPGRQKTAIRFRKDGSLFTYHEIPAEYRSAVLSRIKVMSGLDISEKRKPQDGKIDFKKYGPAKIELRVATLPTAGGLEDVVMRILAGGEPVPLDKLGLTQHNQTRLIDTISKPYGLILVCGPTGSGKTTTLHSVLGYLNTDERKIWTAEDPVEITQKGLRQVQVTNKIGLNFAAAMRSFLRADPDIIMVGEMRDEETTKMGIEASLTGHLVLSTLHTNSAPESVTRLLDMGMDPFNFADALLGILAQRLAKRLCKNCCESYTPDENEIQSLLNEYCLDMKNIEQFNQEDQDILTTTLEEWRELYANDDGEFTLNRAKGCEKCNYNGYSGRVGIHELMAASDDIKQQIIKGNSVKELTEAALIDGMRTLKQDGIAKILMGLTDIMQVRSVCIK